MRDEGPEGPRLTRSAAWFGAALVAATGLVSLLPKPAANRAGGPDTGAEGPAERNLPTARHEREDVTFRGLALGGVGVLASLLIAAGLSWWLFPAPDKTLHFRVPPTAYPTPVLQSDPVADMDRFRAEQLRQLNGTYWLDKAHGTVHLPIQDAMRLVARDGIPDWPKTPYPPVVPAR